MDERACPTCTQVARHKVTNYETLLLQFKLDKAKVAKARGVSDLDLDRSSNNRSLER